MSTNDTTATTEFTENGHVSIKMDDGPNQTQVTQPALANQNGQPAPATKSNWVQFEEETSGDLNKSATIVPSENVQVTIERAPQKKLIKPFATDVPIPGPSGTNSSSQSDTLRTIPLGNSEVIREGFSNGDVIVTLLPVNTRWPWITPAHFRPELVPEELMAQGLTLTVEEYVQAMELLTNDFRFTMYNVCYKRVLIVWILCAFIVLNGLLFSGITGMLLFVLGLMWLVLNASAIFVCVWAKMRLAKGLEKCLAHVNKLLLKHKIILALDDRGKISCHKVNLCFIYMDPSACIAQLQTIIDQQERDPTKGGWEQKMDIDAEDIVIQGSNTTRLSRKQERASLLYLRYASRWGKLLSRNAITFETRASRHCVSSLCVCQFIDGHLKCKPQGKLEMWKLVQLPDFN